MQANVLASHKRLKPSDANPTLSEVVPLDVLIKDIEDGFITARPHYDDPTLQILCYTKETQFAGHWTEATKVARGLVIRSEAYDFSDAVVVERPWRKFFTLEQLKEGD